MDIKQIKVIVDMMKRSDLTEFEIEEKDFKLRIERKAGEGAPSLTIMHYPAGATQPPFPVAAAPVNATESTPAPAAGPRAEDTGKVIKSPMVGTFYRAPSPDSAPFVQEGDTVNESSVVCIIEAMKVMNEIQAEISGKIVEVLAENGDSIEYGQPLFRLK